MKAFATAILLLIFSLNAWASHLVGGNFSLQRVRGDDYILTLQVFRDCEHGIPPFNKDVTVGMYDRADNSLAQSISLGNLISDKHLKFVSNNCINIPTGCTEIGTYVANITLDPNVYRSKIGYYFSWERCCRNTIITNIVTGANSGITGEVYYMEIPPLNIINSTPVFNKDPLTLLCVNNPFTFNYNCKDADGDSLVYTLVTPLKGHTNSGNPNDDTQIGYPFLSAGPYPEVDWKRGYSLNGNIMDGRPALTIDAHTGQLSVTPTRQGVYAIAIMVEEYRKGKRLGEVRRELQLTISSCNNNPSPSYNDSSTNRTYVIHATDTLRFPVIINDPNGDSVYFSYSGTVFSGSTTIKPPYASLAEITTKSQSSIFTYFYWATKCGQESPDTQYVHFITHDNGCPIHKTTLSTIKIVVLPTPLVLPPDIVCLDRIDTNTLQINFGRVNMNKYFSYYLLIRKNPDSTETVIDTIRKKNFLPYVVDTRAYDNMHKFYKYYFVGFNYCGDTGLKSYNVYSDPKYPRQPASRYIITATVKGKKALLEWQAAKEEDFLSYLIYRKTDEPRDTFHFVKSIFNLVDTTFLDSVVDVQKHAYCYRILAASKCGFISKSSNEGCTILLQGSTAPFESRLSWSPYRDWRGGVDYYTIRRRDPGTPEDSIDYAKAPIVNIVDNKLNIDWGIYRYRIVAHEGKGSLDATSESNELQLIQTPMVYPPNAFTPNGDGLNDTWEVVPVFVKDYFVKVYNRWGEKVFEADNKHNRWQGVFEQPSANSESKVTTNRANIVAENVFIYQITYTGWDNSTHYTTGNVTILK